MRGFGSSSVSSGLKEKSEIDFCSNTFKMHIVGLIFWLHAWVQNRKSFTSSWRVGSLISVGNVCCQVGPGKQVIETPLPAFSIILTQPSSFFLAPRASVKLHFPCPISLPLHLFFAVAVETRYLRKPASLQIRFVISRGLGKSFGRLFVWIFELYG